MADWVHCNTCYKQPSPSIKFHLTNCGHIYCENCVASVHKNKCHICGNRCTTIPLSGKMKPDVEVFFTDPAEMLKKQSRSLQKLLQILEFQKNHRTRFVSHNKQLTQKHNSMLNKSQQDAELIKKLQNDMRILKQENNYYKAFLSARGISIETGHGSGGRGPHTTGGTGRTPPLRMGVSRTPPAKLGRSRTPSPQGYHRTTPGKMENQLPNLYESRRSRSGGHSPMNTSPMSGSLPPRHVVPHIPPTCMPITPNCPVTPQYSQTPTNMHSQRPAIQLNYPQGYKTS